ncbi:MAG: hypothetical protein M3499_03065 [Actinomycetota bacterium]|nr:hypothetical protein [Actinomycetota bacterium]
MEIDRKVRQLDNDVQSIYELLATIQGTQERHGNRLRELAEMVAGHDARFDAHDARFDTHDARFDTLDGKLDTVLDLLRQQGRTGEQ